MCRVKLAIPLIRLRQLVAIVSGSNIFGKGNTHICVSAWVCSSEDAGRLKAFRAELHMDEAVGRGIRRHQAEEWDDVLEQSCQPRDCLCTPYLAVL